MTTALTLVAYGKNLVEHCKSMKGRKLRRALPIGQTRFVSVLCVAVLLLFINISTFVTGDCRMEIWVFQTIEQCEAMANPGNNVLPNAKGFLSADGECRTVETTAFAGTADYNLLPGTYSAVCTSDGTKIRFVESGCVSSDCSSPTVGSDVCQRDQTIEASLYSRLSPPEFTVQDPNNANSPGFYSCSRLVGSDKTVTFTVFGNCTACLESNSNEDNDDLTPVFAPIRPPQAPIPVPTPVLVPPSPRPTTRKPTSRPATREPIENPTTGKPSREPTSADEVASLPIKVTESPTKSTTENEQSEEPTKSTTTEEPSGTPQSEPTSKPTVPVRIVSADILMILSRMIDTMSNDTTIVWRDVTTSHVSNSATLEGYTINRIAIRNMTQTLVDNTAQEALLIADPIQSIPPRQLQALALTDVPSLHVQFTLQISIPTSTPAIVTAERVFDEAFDAETERRGYLSNLRDNDDAFSNLTEVRVSIAWQSQQYPTTAPTIEIYTFKPSNDAAVDSLVKSPFEQTSDDKNIYGPVIGSLAGAVVLLIVVAIFVIRRNRRDFVRPKFDQSGAKALEQKGSFTHYTSSADQRWTNEILVDPQLDDVSTLGGSILAGLNLVEGVPDGEDEPTASVNVDYDFARNQYRTGQNAEEERTLDDIRSRSISANSNPAAMNSINNIKFGGMPSEAIAEDDDVSFERQFDGSEDENDENSNEFNNSGKYSRNMPQAAVYTSNLHSPINLIKNDDSRSGIGSTVFRSSTLALLSKPFEILAPPGVLGMVIDTPGGTPLVRAIKTTSVLIDRVQIGDRLLSVDGEDVQNMSAVQVSSLISQKASYNRSLVFVSPRGPESGGAASLKASGLYYSNINS